MRQSILQSINQRMVDAFFTMPRFGFVLGASLLFALTTCTMSERRDAAWRASAPLTALEAEERAAVVPASAIQNQKPSPEKPLATMPPVIGDLLDSGTLIVISKKSQNMHVFHNGELWDTSPVSTGKRGKETPTGVFPILQKKTFHRSNIYSNAPMPHMQRLTWDGIAIHAGYVPGYPASHGCIRLPPAFAKALFKQTAHETTAVVVVDQAVASKEHAMQVALRMPIPVARADGSGGLNQGNEPVLAHIPPPTQEVPGEEAMPTQLAQSGEIIQLAAAPTAAGAKAQWADMLTSHPELEELKMAVIPATVNGAKVFRLRAGGGQAYAACDAIKAAGGACFPVS